VDQTDPENSTLDLSPIEYPGVCVFVCQIKVCIEQLNFCLNDTGQSLDLPDITFSSLDRTVMPVDTKVKLLTYRVLKRKGEKFLGALSRSQCYKIWCECFNLPGTLVHGIALVQQPNLPFLFDIHLFDDILVSEVPKTFTHEIEGCVYEGELIKDEGVVPLLGDEIKIFIRRTRFRVSPIQLKPWLSIFGVLVDEPAYIRDEEATNLCTDDLTCSMILSKHIYGLLPAFGRKIKVSYKGQPIQCGKCFGQGHIRSECTKERVDWLKYTKQILEENNLPSSMIGRWYDLIRENNV